MEKSVDLETGRPRSRRRRCVRWSARAAAGLGLILLVLSGYLVVAANRSHDVRALPRTVDSRPIGRSRLELAVPNRAQGRHAGRDSVWLWFPSVADRDQAPAAYAPGPWNGLHLSNPLGQLETSFDDLRIRSREQVRPATGRFPLIILEPGMGFAAPQYQALAEDLASAGFIVAGVTPTGSANVTVLGGHVIKSNAEGNPPDLGTHSGRPQAEADRLVGKWADAAVAVARTLRHTGIIAAHLQPGSVYAGHSFGGAASIQACHDDPSCRGAVDLDGTQFGDVVHTGLDKPLMIIGSGDSCVTGRCPAGARNSTDDVRVAGSLLQHSHGPAWCPIVAGTRHFNFSDYGSYYLALPLRTLLALGSVNGARATRTIDRSVIGFARFATTGRSEQALTTMRRCS
ncbi:alpha/beta hydrolase [Microlunatus sp. Gsoil 973]|uniref:alpha/beta hydrolase n=1 Tax=Microlunatus sp. Gsoil 973 TaxID=2672569 RepID=UPI0012B4CC1D|nr:alpha/beta hydrolase [Microlunatus sp. Gsoil 973]QGN32217.1 alpha/beta hydrolase [Microlunatus sp. Gsoil 973]